MTPPRGLAAAQTIPVGGDVGANLEQHLELAPELAFSEDDPRLRPLQETAAATSTTFVVGAPLRAGDRLHIGAFVLTPDRSVEVYTKRHLGAFSSEANPDGPVPPPEPSVFAPGETEPLAQIGESVVGVGICSDVNHPSYVDRTARRGARTYFASTTI